MSFGEKVIPAGAESSYLNQPTYASKASQPHSQGRESRRDAYERRAPPTGYSALRRKGKEASQRPLSQSTAPSSAISSARAKRIVEVPRPPHEHDSAGWNRNVEHILDYFLYQEVDSLSPEQRAGIVDKVLAKMDELDEMKLWFFKRERQPLSFMSYLAEVVDQMSGHHLTDIRLYTRWIQPGSYYHLRILEREELNHCPHLQHAGPPRSDVELPSVTSLRTHRRSFELADANPQTTIEAFQKTRHNLCKSLILHGKNQEARELAAKKAPSGHKAPQPPSSAEPKGATSAVPTHRGGDATSWAATMDKEDKERERGWDKPRARSHKRRQEASRSRSAPERLSLSFPLQSDEERKQACESLYEVVRAINIIQRSWMFEIIMARLINDQCSQGDMVQFTNLLLASVAE